MRGGSGSNHHTNKPDLALERTGSRPLASRTTAAVAQGRGSVWESMRQRLGLGGQGCALVIGRYSARSEATVHRRNPSALPNRPPTYDQPTNTLSPFTFWRCAD